MTQSYYSSLVSPQQGCQVYMQLSSSPLAFDLFYALERWVCFSVYPLSFHSSASGGEAGRWGKTLSEATKSSRDCGARPSPKTQGTSWLPKSHTGGRGIHSFWTDARHGAPMNQSWCSWGTCSPEPHLIPVRISSISTSLCSPLHGPCQMFPKACGNFIHSQQECMEVRFNIHTTRTIKLAAKIAWLWASFLIPGLLLVLK